MSTLRFQRPDGALSPVGRATGLLAVWVVTLLAYLAADPAAHEFFHHDADQAGHACVVTVFAHGEGLYVPPRVVPRPDRRMIAGILAPAAPAPAQAAARRLQPSRGPPAAA